MRVFIFISFLTLGLSLTLGPLIISQYKKEKRTILGHVDNFLILFSGKSLLTPKGVYIQKVVRSVFYLSLFSVVGAFVLIILFDI
ncbi:hypothetical protein MOVI109754_22655 [Moritella viscosa]